MKKSFNLIFRIGIIIAMFLNHYSMHSQYYHANDYYNSSACSEISDPVNYSASTTYDFENAIPKVYNVHLYGLELTSGSYTGSDRLTEELALERIAQLNIVFNPYKIFFKYGGIDFYSELIPDGPCEGQELATTNFNCMGNRMPEVIDDDGNENKINIILHHPGTCNNYKGEADIYEKTLSFRYCTFGNEYVIYQMGHLFGLFKTQRGTNVSGSTSDPTYETIPQDPYCDDPGYPFPYPYQDGGYMFMPDFGGNPPGEIENVTRDVNNQYYNADIAGDMVTDTPASYNGAFDSYCHLFNGNSTYEFIEHADIVDNSPEHLMYVNVDILNHMSFSWNPPPVNLCHFTDGQGVRMRETIEIASLNFDEVETTVASLYEPYAGEYRRIGPEQQSDEAPHFQWGFDYEFVDCSGDYELPSDYEDISFDYTEDKLNEVGKYDWYLHVAHPNHSAIRIIQIDKTQPRKCYDNWNRRPSSGGITIFHDGVINNNYTSYPKDSLQINSPTLIQDLQNGLYKIDKQYNDGDQEQNVIIKN